MKILYRLVQKINKNFSKNSSQKQHPRAMISTTSVACQRPKQFKQKKGNSGSGQAAAGNKDAKKQKKTY